MRTRFVAVAAQNAANLTAVQVYVSHIAAADISIR